MPPHAGKKDYLQCAWQKNEVGGAVGRVGGAVGRVSGVLGRVGGAVGRVGGFVVFLYLSRV